MRFACLAIVAAIALSACANGQGASEPSASNVAREGDEQPLMVPLVDVAAERDHAVSQLVGRWVYEVCDDAGNCETVVRTYEEAPAVGLVRYTEFYNGTTNEGFVGYDLERDGFVEFDYPQNWDSLEFERRYRSEDEAIRLFGETPFGGPEDRVLQWHMNEEGSTMILSTGVGDVSAPPSEFLDVIFSRVPLVGDNEDSN